MLTEKLKIGGHCHRFSNFNKINRIINDRKFNVKFVFSQIRDVNQLFRRRVKFVVI